MATPLKIESYLRDVFGPEAKLISINALGQEEHDTGISNLLRLEVQVGSATQQLILRRPAPTVYGTEQLADRAQAVLQAYEAYRHLPRHPRSLDVAVLRKDGTLSSIPGDTEFVLLQEYAPGTPYVLSLLQSLRSEELDELAERRAAALAEYLLSLHRETRDDSRVYRRSLRDLIAGGTGAMGVIGGYAQELRDAFHAELNDILRDFISLAWHLDRYPCRLCRIHGDFHPLNVLFGEATELSVIDSAGIGWGDAALDVGNLLMNYYTLYNQPGRLSSPSGRRLAERFLQTYVAGCSDVAGLYRVLPLPMARVALIMATTDFFPHRPMDERRRLIQLAGSILSAGVFSPHLFTT